jgi:hypothetical protein
MKNSKRPSRKHKACTHELEFMTLDLKGLPKADAQFNAEGFSKGNTK